MRDVKIRTIFGVGAAFAASVPWLWKSHYMLQLLAFDGLNSPVGVGSDMVIGFGLDLVFLFASVIVLSFSYMVLKKWCRPALYILIGVVLMAVVQDVTVYALTDTFQKCGGIVCNGDELPEPKAPEMKTLK